MSTSPPSSPVDDGLGHIPSADDLAAAAAASERPHASLTPDLSNSGGLPLATSSPNPIPPIPLSVPTTTPPPGGLPPSIAGVVDFKLALDGTNFTRWRNYFNLLFARYHAETHVQAGASARLADPQWRDDDNTIRLWFFSTIEGDLLDLVAPPDSTAYTIWQRLHEYFLANEAEHAMHLGQEFRACVRGDLSISEYCRRLQGIAAALADVREPVTDRTPTLQMLDGVGKKFELPAAIIQSTVPLPKFAQARSRLVLAKLAIDKRARTEGAQVLAALHDDARGADGRGDRGGGPPGGGPSPGGNGGRGGPPGGNGGGHPGGGNRGRGGRGRGGRGRGRGDPAGGGGGPQPWLGYFAPMGMPFPPLRSPWIPPNSAGVLGPRPGAPHHVYSAYTTAPTLPPPPPYAAASPYSWDATAMFHAAPSQGHGYPPQADWIMDTGASSHVTGDPGSSHQGGSSEVQ
ncbi:uncharacterized protein [Triticum aestivum]|uniref:uncharacterized protein n=1 Tax=Triticum aestivum TaxID=4565 RepID=UPI001D026369|nr:uncharacterized protein LOC123040703 [Triticum aestivum]XP_044319438.1 uncharacterized protein LOC123040739 [Triticum aestivum]